MPAYIPQAKAWGLGGKSDKVRVYLFITHYHGNGRDPILAHFSLQTDGNRRIIDLKSSLVGVK